MAVEKFRFPTMHPVAGFRLGTTSAGIKKAGRKDVVVMEIAEGGSVVGAFTKNRFCAAPVHVCRDHLANTEARFLVVNTGNANACTGDRGMQDALKTCEVLAKEVGVDLKSVLPFSTGVIGEHLPMDRLLSALPSAVADLSVEGWADAATGIMTTDTREKGASVQFEHEGKTVTVTGIAKGSGMIKPNMATMLAFVATDAAVEKSLLQGLLSESVEQSFNRITVDGDTSTNDSSILIATGCVDLPLLNDAASPLYHKLQAALVDVHIQLAQNIVADGEGATKFISVNVAGGKTEDECLKVAYAIAHSPLIKTACYASDPNWGRIVAAIGYAGVDNLDADAVSVKLDDVLIVEKGGRAATYQEEMGQSVMTQAEFAFNIELNRGDAKTTVWTCDFSHEYVSINADYRS